MITIYGRANCTNCRATEQYLDRFGIHYLYVDLTDNQGELDKLAEMGYSALPVVVGKDKNGNDYSFCGFNQQFLKKIIEGESANG